MRRVADPRQVLHLVDDVDAVGPGPHATVGEDLPEIEGQDPQRRECEQPEHRELETVDAPRSPCGHEPRQSLAPWRSPRVSNVELYAHESGAANTAVVIAA